MSYPEGVDVSYAQGNYVPGAEAFVIVNASRANIGLAVGSQYANQVANARNAGKHVGHYFFNGNIDPVQCADFFVANLHYQPGDSLWLDCEAEPSTGTAAWGPAQAAAFNARVMAHGLPCPGTYLNKSLMDGADWSPVVAQGSPLWIAYYNPTPPPIQWWPTWTLWQYTSTPIDRDRAQSSDLASLGSTTLLGGFLMALSDDQQRQIYEALVSGGLTGFYKTDAIVNILRGELEPVVNAIQSIVGQPVQRDGKTVAQIQDNADTNTMVRQLLGRATVAPSIDYPTLAAEIVKLLPASTLTKQDVVDALNSVKLSAS